MQWKSLCAPVMRSYRIVVNGVRRSRGRPKRTWIKAIKNGHGSGEFNYGDDL